MKSWDTNAVEKAQGRQKPRQERRTAQVGGNPSPEPKEPGRKRKNEPAEKQVKLPPPPEKAGPWRIGPWELRSTTTYLPVARLVLTGPAADFENLLAYLNAYQP